MFGSRTINNLCIPAFICFQECTLPPTSSIKFTSTKFTKFILKLYLNSIYPIDLQNQHPPTKTKVKNKPLCRIRPKKHIPILFQKSQSVAICRWNISKGPTTLQSTLYIRSKPPPPSAKSSVLD